MLPGHDATELRFPSAWPPFAFFRMIITHLLPSAMCGRAADGPENWNTGKQVLLRGKERKRKVRREILRLAPGKGALREWVPYHQQKPQKEKLGKKDTSQKETIRILTPFASHLQNHQFIQFVDSPVRTIVFIYLHNTSLQTHSVRHMDNTAISRLQLWLFSLEAT